ncbi:MAG TPA: TetR/AcrR family transcriptional regulator [Ktedonobacterales bacterium]|nr:TetR/AcrR family transcriptional regulator [Ktedonobacterales bacterium]
MSYAEVQGDLRVRRTHKLLWEALLSLMAEQDFETISVKDICERAMVHRTTFYKHYQDKYDLLEHEMQQTHETLIAELERTGKGAAPTPFFEYVARHERFYQVMLCGKGVGSFQARLRDYFAETIAAEMQRQERAGKTFAVPQPVLAHFYAGAVVNTLTWWLSDGLRYTPEQMGQYLMSLLGETA